MAYLENYITLDEYVAKRSSGMHYTGFVIGYGYIWMKSSVLMPPNQHGYNATWTDMPVSLAHNIVYYDYVEETTPEAVKHSLRGLFKDGKAVITVVPGITLSAIAALFDVTVDDLVRWNNIENPDKITVGQKITVSEKTPNTTTGSQETSGSENFLFSPAMNVISLLLAIASTGASAYQSLPAYNRMAAELAKKAPNRFLARYNGKIVDWSMKFKANQSVNKTIVATEKASYLKTLKWLKGIKFAGYLTSALGVYISGKQAVKSKTIEQKVEYITDTGMGIAGFIPGGGWIVSSMYYFTKPLQYEWKEHVLSLQIKTGIEGCASIMPFK